MSNNKSNILIVEDEQSIARFLSLELQHEGYTTKCITSGRDALSDALAFDYDLIVLDVMLPDLNGIEVLRRLRAVKSTPVIILTARDTVVDKVSGLDLGADDYMTKPFAIEELLARIRSIIKKTTQTTQAVAAATATTAAPIQKQTQFTLGELSVDTRARIAKYGDKLIDLTKKEFDLLAYLLENRNVVIEREKILDVVWGFDFYGSTNVVDVYVRYLRSKIDDVYRINLIETVRGAGYTIR